LSEVHNKQTIP
jgi:hypothetical protein